MQGQQVDDDGHDPVLASWPVGAGRLSSTRLPAGTPSSRSNGVACAPPSGTPWGPCSHELPSASPVQSTAEYSTIASLPLCADGPVPLARTVTCGSFGGVVPLGTVMVGSVPGSPSTVGRPAGRSVTGVFSTLRPFFGYVAMMSTTKTRVSLPLMPASALPFLPYPCFGGTVMRTRLPTFFPTRVLSHPVMTPPVPIGNAAGTLRS